MFFNEYIEKRKRIDQGDRHENSVSYTLLKYIKKKIILRVIINLIGLTFFFGSSVLAWAYLVQDWPLSAEIAFAVLRPLFFIGGFMLILLMLMLGKSRFLRVFFKLKGLQIISQLSFGISLWYPLICLAFYFSQHQFTNIGYLTMSYYFVGSFMIATLVAYLLYILIQGPVASLA
jgi:hypothetical protein